MCFRSRALNAYDDDDDLHSVFVKIVVHFETSSYHHIICLIYMIFSFAKIHCFIEKHIEILIILAYKDIMIIVFSKLPKQILFLFQLQIE